MSSSIARNALLAFSLFVVVLMIGGGVAVKVGAAEGSYRNVITFSEVLGLVRDNYVDPVEEKDLLLGAYEGLLGSLDGRGAYLTPPEVEAWKKPQGEASGTTGMSVLKAGSIVQVVAVDPGSPAEGAGIKIGDQIRRIEGRPVRALSWDQVVRLLRGAPGSSVGVTFVLPREGFRREDRQIARAVPKSPAYTVRVERGVAVAKLLDLPRIDPAALRNDLRKAREEGGGRLLLDLRNTVDGVPRAVAPIAGLFTSGNLLSLKDKSGKQVEAVAASGDGAAWSGEVAVLVNGGTAGASEALAVALQKRRAAKIYGEGTFGLGAETRLVDLADGAGLLIPSLVWEAEGGTRWNEEGLKPDLEIRVEYRIDDEADEAEAEQLRRTIDEIVKEKASPAAPAKAA